MNPHWQEALDRDGFVLLPGLFPSEEVQRLRDALAAALAEGADGTMRSSAGAVYGARNVLERFPPARASWT